MKVVISGYFGVGNAGDEAILLCLLSGLRKYYPKIEIMILSKQPEKTYEQYKTPSLSSRNPFAIITAILRSDVLISGGGGLLQNETSKFSLLYYLGILLLAKLLRRHAAVVGQGIGPIRGSISRNLTRMILNRVDLIIVRDEKSFALLRTLKVKNPIFIAGDVAGMLKGIDDKKLQGILAREELAKKDRPIIGISVRDLSYKLSKSEIGNYREIIAHSIDQLVEKYSAKAVFVPFHYPSDLVESEKIAAMMKNPYKIIRSQYSPEELLGIIGKADVMIGTRFHSLVFSMIQGIPFIGLSYDPKVASFALKINQSFVDIRALNKEKLVSIFDEIWTKRSELSEEIKKKAVELDQKALENFKIFFDHFEFIKKTQILGIEFDNVDETEAIEKVLKFIKERKPSYVVTPNPEIVVNSLKDPELKTILDRASLKLPDGIGIVLASKILGGSIRKRVSGIDIIPGLLKEVEKEHYGVFLLGGKPGIVHGASQALKTDFKKLNIVGMHHGYFSGGEEAFVIKMIKDAKPDLLLIGMGHPKQERFISKYLLELNVPCAITIGGSLDVISGGIKRAPKLLRLAGLEWLYRITTQPSRLKRAMVLPYFIFKVIGEAFKKRIK